MADYKNTVFLPETDFPLRAGLAQKEPEILEFWKKIGLDEKLFAANEGKSTFVLHDGPPFANGNMHIGHALNRILKDVVNRTKRMQGHNVHPIPGWDCHGLPIEWKIEQEYRARGKSKDEVPPAELIKECRAFAANWIEIQREELKRLGLNYDWQNPYLTMAPEAEAAIAGEVHKFLMSGSLYRGDRPVMWSVVEKTALAEAEIEYQDHKSPTVWIRFPVKSSPVPQLSGASIVIWTTTPWTLPANQALACGAEIEYGIYEVKAVGEGSLAKIGEKLVVATALAAATAEKAKIQDWSQLATVSGQSLVGTICAHPLASQGYTDDRPLWTGDFVTTEAGTGFVHIAPSHGEDDFNLGVKNGIKIQHFVGPDGVYYDRVPLFAGKRVLTEDGKEGDANGSVIKAMIEAGGLLAKGSLTHSYPHSWRSKAPIIFRCTPQWFISMEHNGLRQKALKAIDDTRWVPAQGKNRIQSMVEGRQFWNLSRQRLWGVPVAMFVHKQTQELLKDEEVNQRIQEVFAREGIEAWHTRPAQDFLGNKYKAEDYEQVKDIVDVWFESGSTHSFTLEKRPYMKWPADLYLEGSDQHRGWFQSSLLEGSGTRGRAPFNTVMTHGFTLDEKGYKQSKSLGNVTAPMDVIKEYGADVLRLTLINSDYFNDISIGPNILKQQSEQYRRIRNTMRYLLGALKGFKPSERTETLPPLEKWVLHRLTEVDAELKAAIEAYNFHRYFRTLHDFCAGDLSAFYFDIRKDSLYCDAEANPTRKAVRTVMEQLFLALTAWLAPILPFTSEEAWQEWKKQGHEGPESAHLRLLPAFPVEWRDEKLGAKWESIRKNRLVATGVIEQKRAEKLIGSSLEASLALEVPAPEAAAFEGIDLAEITITSSAKLVKGDKSAATVEKALGAKCERCWRVLPEVGQSKTHPELCLRCEGVVSAQTATAA